MMMMMFSPHHHRPSPPPTQPRSIYDLSKEAHDGLHFSPRYALTTWTRSAESLFSKSEQYETHGNLEDAFVLMARAAVLYLEKIPSHPDYPGLSSLERTRLRNEGERCLRALTEIKRTLVLDPLPVVHPASQQFVGDPSYTVGQVDRSLDPGRSWINDGYHQHHPTTTPNPDRLEQEESLYLAEQRKKWEIECRDYEFAKRLASDQEREAMGGYSTPSVVGMSDVSRDHAGERGYRGSLPHGTDAGPSSTITTMGAAQTIMPDPRDYQRKKQEVGRVHPGQVDEQRHEAGYGHLPYPYPYPNTHPYPHPPAQMQSPSHAQRYTHPHAHSHTPIPAHPVEESRHSTSSSPRPRPIPSRDNRPLRPLHVPISLIPTFLRIASSHTQRGIEMCGLLLGQVRPPYSSAWRHSSSRDPRHSRSGSGTSSIAQSVLGHREEEEGELVVQAVLIPRQEGTSDTCTMKEEEKVVGVQLERGLIALGWIHTHPTQSCFMSSMDLHTHSAYQQTLPEAIAIVCAPRCNPSFGIFRLTEPAGLATILQCKRMQTFHDHPKIPGGLYTDADQGGHVWLNEHGRGIEVIDLRR